MSIFLPIIGYFYGPLRRFDSKHHISLLGGMKNLQQKAPCSRFPLIPVTRFLLLAFTPSNSASPSATNLCIWFLEDDIGLARMRIYFPLHILLSIFPQTLLRSAVFLQIQPQTGRLSPNTQSVTCSCHLPRLFLSPSPSFPSHPLPVSPHLLKLLSEQISQT